MASRDQKSSALNGPTLYRPAEVAKALRCSEWWIKEQARNRRIPFSWIGGSYLFTEQHVTEIVRIFEERPSGSSSDVAHANSDSRKGARNGTPKTQLRARTPRRAARSPRSSEAA